MKDIKVVIENLSAQGIAPNDQQTLFLKEFIQFDLALDLRNYFSLRIIQLVIFIFGVLLEEVKPCFFRLSKILFS